MNHYMMVHKLNINNFIKDIYTPAKPVSIKIKFVPLDADVEELCNELPVINHAQAKSMTTKWPFAAMQNVKECCFLQSHILAEGDSEMGTKHLMEIIFDAKAFSDFDIAAGDTVGILPQNSVENVQRVLKSLNLEETADKYYRMEFNSPTDKKSALLHVPNITTPREILRDCLNLQDVPKKQFLSALASFCQNEKERAFLSCLSAKEGSPYYDEIILQKKYNLLDILELCPTCRPPLELLVQSMQRLLPRPYSVAKSLNQRPNEIQIIFSVKPNDPGVTSGMLAKLIRKNDPSNSSCYMYLRTPTDFRYTENQVANNQVFICVGTALAPFVGFLEEKAFHSRTHKKVGQTWLFLGAKTKNHVIHRQRLQEWQENGILNEYFEALSRDSVHSKYKYVQECMLDYKQKLSQFWLQSNTTIYVCGDGGVISKDIMKTITAILGNDDNEAKELLIRWKTNGKLIEHNWW